MCREEAKELNERFPEMREAGAKRIVAVVKENIPQEIKEFREFWSGEIYLDEEKAFYKAIGGGKEHKQFNGVVGFLAALANPFSSIGKIVKAHAKRAENKGVKGNLNGEGFVQGGLYVVRKNGQSQLKFLESNLGDLCPVDDVVKAVRECSTA